MPSSIFDAMPILRAWIRSPGSSGVSNSHSFLPSHNEPGDRDTETDHDDNEDRCRTHSGGLLLGDAMYVATTFRDFQTGNLDDFMIRKCRSNKL